MKEENAYQTAKIKLNYFCTENGFVFRIERNKFPFAMIIMPDDRQVSMFENESDGTKYIEIKYENMEIRYSIFGGLCIDDNAWKKLSNIFKELYTAWISYFFRDVISNGKITDRINIPYIEDDIEDTLSYDPRYVYSNIYHDGGDSDE